MHFRSHSCDIAGMHGVTPGLGFVAVEDARMWVALRRLAIDRDDVCTPRFRKRTTTARARWRSNCNSHDRHLGREVAVLVKRRKPYACCNSAIRAAAPATLLLGIAPRALPSIPSTSSQRLLLSPPPKPDDSYLDESRIPSRSLPTARSRWPFLNGRMCR